MHRPILLITALIAATVVGSACSSPTERRFRQHVEYLASDSLEGRGVGTPGIQLAADYIAAHFERAGLEPGGDAGSYFQTFEIPHEKQLTSDTRLAFSNAGTLQLHKDYVPFPFSSDEPFDAEVVFCGYGIVDEERSVDDFVHLDLDGKVALILRGEPPSWAGTDGTQTKHAMLRNKVYNAKDRGAAAVLIVNQQLEGEADRLVDFEQRSADEYGIPAFHLKREAADAALAKSDFGSLQALQSRLDDGGHASGKVAGLRASGRAGFRTAKAPTHNVIGVLRGSGPLAQEAVVIGAHYDHLGVRKPMMRKFKDGKLVREEMEPQIHNGADDNASGVAGLIEIAYRFAEGPPPDRSVVFIAFTAEETGLQGSTHYMKKATVPVEQTVAMLNMDMIGRLPPDTRRIIVFGTKTGEGIEEISRRAASELGLELAATPSAGGRSDHAPFVRAEIPSLHFFTGHHSDYHQPSDDVALVDFAGGSLVAELVYRTARDIANLEQRPKFQLVKAEGESEMGGTPSFRVVMGLTPGYVDDGERGMKVEAVNSDGPADLAGMQAGDRIVQIGDKPVANIYDYMAATRNNSAGDVVEVIVLRDGREQRLNVTLSAAR